MTLDDARVVAERRRQACGAPAVIYRNRRLDVHGVCAQSTWDTIKRMPTFDRDLDFVEVWPHTQREAV